MCDLIPLLDQMIALEGISSPFSFFSHFEIILSEVINPTTAEQGKVVLGSLFGSTEACFKHSVIFYPCLIQWTRTTSSGLLTITHHNGRWINRMESNTNPIFFSWKILFRDERKTWCKRWLTSSKVTVGLYNVWGPEHVPSSVTWCRWEAEEELLGFL